jgi:hypothetical protein
LYLFETHYWAFVYKDETIAYPIIQTVTLPHQHLPLLQLPSADTKPDSDTDFQNYYTTDKYPCTHTVYMLELHYADIHLHSAHTSGKLSTLTQNLHLIRTP